MDYKTHIYDRSPPWLQTALLNLHAARIERHRYGTGFRAEVEWLLETQTWSADRIREHQNSRLRKVVSFAYSGSAYYRRLLNEHGVSPSELRSVDDLRQLPLISKDDVKKAGEEMLTSQPRRDWLHGHTSGTTGSPLSLWYDRRTCIMTNAVDRRHKIWAGMSSSDWIGVFLGRSVVPPSQKTGQLWRTNWIQRQVWFSSFHMTPENLDRYISEIRRRDLRFLEGYPSTLYLLARHVLDQGLSLPMVGAITSSETLHPVQRATIENAFQCELYDFYALAERVAYAGECGLHAGKHIAEEYSFVEIVDAEGERVRNGELGYLVGTSLYNTAMPLVRYRTDDLSAIIPGDCECGRTHRRLRDVTTKAEDIVVTPDGRLISPSALTHPFKPFDSIDKSQIIQIARDRLVVKLVPREHFTDEVKEVLVARLRERLGSEMVIDVEVVDDIPRESSGKFRWVISRIETPYEFSWE